jgi:hypothetical protein
MSYSDNAYYNAIKRALSQHGLTLEAIHEDQGHCAIIEAIDNSNNSVTVLVTIEEDCFLGGYYANIEEYF